MLHQMVTLTNEHYTSVLRISATMLHEYSISSACLKATTAPSLSNSASSVSLLWAFCKEASNTQCAAPTQQVSDSPQVPT